MARYLRITNCIYCTHRRLGKDGEPYCHHGKGEPAKIDERRSFDFSMPHWCPLPTLWELLRRVLGG